MARSRFALAAAMAALAACSGGSSGSGTVAVHLVDAPADYKEINLNITGVEIHGDSVGWLDLGKPDPALMPVDLLKLTGGVAATLVPKTAVPADTYSQMRLHLGPGNTVVLQDGSVHDLTVPSGLQSGLKLVIKLHVEPGADKDVFIDFDARNSIHLHGTGSGKYILRPVIFATEKAVAGAIAGKLTFVAGEATEPSPLPGVEVMAEAFDSAGNPVVVAATKTLADGSYKLEHLPFGAYHVVSQPVVGSTSYSAQASGPIVLDADRLLGSWSATFAPAGQVGGIGGKITPKATDLQADAVAIRQLLGPTASARPFVVRRSAVDVPAAGDETYSFGLLPTGAYDVVATRRTFDATGAVVGVAVKGPLAAAVAAGAGTAVDVAF